MVRDVHEEFPPRDTAGASDPAAGSSRRQWLKGVGAASPVMLTLVSPPVRANDACILPSGFVSQNTYNSRHPDGNPPPCGNGPNQYLGQGTAGLGQQSQSDPGQSGNAPGQAPPTYNAAYWPTSRPNTQTTNFNSPNLFGSTNSNAFEAGLISKNWTMWDVLNSPGVTPFTKYCIAAYLNARTGTPEFPLTPAQAIGVWRHFRTHSSSALVPSSWTEDDALTWLRVLMQ